MAETVTEVATIPQGMGFQLLEQGMPGAMFTGDVGVFKVADDAEPDVVTTLRITVDVDSLTLTLTPANAEALRDAIAEALAAEA